MNRDALKQQDLKDGTTLVGSLSSSLARGVTLTSSYSGIGTPEFALTSLAGKCGGADVSLYSACDWSDKARAALSSHTSGPSHIFTDLMHRIDSRTREKLWSLQETVAGQLSGLLAEVAAEAEQATERFADAVKLTGMKFTRQARLILSKASFPEKSPCARCQQNCSHRPDARLIARERLWLEVAGVTCVAFSRFGSLLKWADKSAVVCLVWGILGSPQPPRYGVHRVCARVGAMASGAVV